MLDRLVADGIRRHGRFASRPVEVDPLDEIGRLWRPLRRLRLKEWVGFAVFHPDVWTSMIVQDAKYLATSELITFRPAGGATHHRVVGRSGAAKLPAALFGHEAGMARPGYEVAYRFDVPGGRHRIRVDVAATAEQPAVGADLELDGASAPPPLSVSAPLPGSPSLAAPSPSAMYTYKCVYPVSGTLRIGADEYTFDPGRDLAIVDEHRSGLPYRTRWVWGTFAAHVDAAIVGANFAHRPMVPGSEDESCLWSPTAAEALTGVDFAHDPSSPLGPWQVRSRDGRLDVTFEPVNREEVRRQLGVFAIDYFMLQGVYSGTIAVGGRTYGIEAAHGVCERMHARL